MNKKNKCEVYAEGSLTIRNGEGKNVTVLFDLEERNFDLEKFVWGKEDSFIVIQLGAVLCDAWRTLNSPCRVSQYDAKEGVSKVG
ncbi:hypothetical protein NE619_03905 [Anaerovorax odorimutans]|uniref:DUF2442 domain-containing protein n=1 Tax=Anaerovorax odorimutans TaxID=109327 RepID=A0ABT1RL15_9FIRM|nr:hypothetical protein [Anaerovorax odorimutans]MCQ4635862.1 hypothetical protein [Anaerovorax odorimutans]